MTIWTRLLLETAVKLEPRLTSPQEFELLLVENDSHCSRIVELVGNHFDNLRQALHNCLVNDLILEPLGLLRISDLILEPIGLHCKRSHFGASWVVL